MEDLVVYMVRCNFFLKIISLYVMLCSFYGSLASGDLDTPATQD